MEIPSEVVTIDHGDYPSEVVTIDHGDYPSEVVTIDHGDPLWINDRTKNLIETKKKLYKIHLKKNNNVFKKLKDIKNEIRLTLKSSKTYYFILSSKKLNQKCYWSILKSFLNGTKFPCIPPIFHNDNFVTDI